MPLSYNIPRFSSNVPWWMYDLDNHQLITTSIIPSDIKDSKSIIIAETPIPGRNFQPINHGGNGNRKISFSIRIIKRNNTVGNVLLLKQFEMLRNQSDGFFGILPRQFSPNPKVLYYWGTGSLPLVYYVTKCDFAHRSDMVNEMGNPQYTDIEMELTLDETDPLYKGEEVYRKMSAIVGNILNGYNVVEKAISGEKSI